MFIVLSVSLFSESLAQFFQGNKILKMFISMLDKLLSKQNSKKFFVKIDLVSIACIVLSYLGGGLMLCVQTVTSHINIIWTSYSKVDNEYTSFIVIN